MYQNFKEKDMEKDTIDFMKMQVEHANNISNVMIGVAGLITAIALAVVVYQISLNKQTIRQLKKENETMIRNLVWPLFKEQVDTKLRTQYIRITDIEALLSYYKQFFEDNKDATEYMKSFKKKALYQIYYYLLTNGVTFYHNMNRLDPIIKEVFDALSGVNQSSLKREQLSRTKEALFNSVNTEPWNLFEGGKLPDEQIKHINQLHDSLMNAFDAFEKYGIKN